MLAVVDTGPLYATVDRDDADHDACAAVLEDARIQLAVPALVVAEATYLIGSRLGPRVEATFLKGLQALFVEAPKPDDWPRIGELVRKYGDFLLGGTDASVIALAERLDASTIITLDRRRFSAVRTKLGNRLRLLP